jgi:hypothetical protein
MGQNSRVFGDKTHVSWGFARCTAARRIGHAGRAAQPAEQA